MADLPAEFHFTQQRMQDYLDCKRRFQLRYLLEQPWPAQVVEPADLFELHMEQGKRFHRLVQQYLLGLPIEALNKMASEPPLSRWWQAFLDSGLNNVPEMRFPELSLSTRLSGFRLVSKYDLISMNASGKTLIVDWKTSGRIPTLSEVRLSMQSRLYPYILARAGLSRFGAGEISADQISMRYWYAEDPGSPQEFGYSQDEFIADELFISELIEQIQSLSNGEFSLTDDARKCRYCVYRSLCDRGEQAGPMGALDADLELLGEAQGEIAMDRRLPDIEP